MKIRYLIDADTGQPHCYRHSVKEYEVEEVMARPGEDRKAREDSRVAIGQTRAGRTLRVVYVPEDEGLFVITAFDLVGKPLAAYRRRMRRRSG